MKQKTLILSLIMSILLFSSCSKKLYHAQVQMKIDGQSFNYSTDQVQMDEKDKRLSFYLLRHSNKKQKPYLILRYYLGNPIAKFWLRYNKPGVKHYGYMQRFECYVPAIKPFHIFEKKLDLTKQSKLSFSLYHSGRYHIITKAKNSLSCQLWYLAPVKDKKLKDKKSWKMIAKNNQNCSFNQALSEGRYRIAFQGKGEAHLFINRKALLKTNKFWTKSRGAFGEKTCQVKLTVLGKEHYKLTFDAILSHSVHKKKRNKKKKAKRRISLKLTGFAIIKAGKITKLLKTVKPAKSTQPKKTVKPAKPTQPKKTVKPAKPTQPKKTVKPAKPTQSKKTTK